MGKTEYNPRANGMSLYVSASVANIRSAPGVSSTIAGRASKGDVLRRTGKLWTQPGTYQWYEVEKNYPVPVRITGWVRSDVVVADKNTVKAANIPAAKASGDAGGLLANILRNDAYTYQNLLIAKSIFVRHEELAKQFAGAYNALGMSLNARQEKVKDNESLRTTAKKETALWTRLNILIATHGASSGVSGYRIGLPFLIPVGYVIGAAVIAGGALATVLYYTFKEDEPKSFSDFKGSEQLVKKLYAVLPKEKADEILADVKSVSYGAYAQGKTDGGGTSAKLKNYGIFAALAAGAYLLTKKNKRK